MTPPTCTNREIFSYKAGKLNEGHAFLTTDGLLHAPIKHELKLTSPDTENFTSKRIPNKEPTVYINVTRPHCYEEQTSSAINLDIHRPELVTHT